MAAVGAYEMTQVVAAGGVTFLEGVLTALFVVTFAWISLRGDFGARRSCCALRLARKWRFRPEKLVTRTALVMPIYHEDPAKTAAALEAMARGLARQGYGAGVRDRHPLRLRAAPMPGWRRRSPSTG